MSDPSATILGAIIGGAIGIVASIIGGTVAADWHVFHTAAQKLKTTFLVARTKVSDRRITNPEELESILIAEFPGQQLAIAEFRLVLPEEDVPAFDNAWEQYYEWEKADVKPKELNFIQYTMPKHDGEISLSSKKLAIKRVDAILSFTKRKPFYKRWLKIKLC
jgi:hypothetical protein